MQMRLRGVDKKDIVFAFLLFVVFAALVYLFPASGDDWAWGSKLGVERLQNGFADYNGRYLGNLLVLALTRSELLNMVLTGLCLVCVCILPKVFAGSKGFLPFAFGTMLFLLMSRGMFVQSVVWTSGFSNYVPPILLTFLYFLMVQDVFDDRLPKYSLLEAAVSAVLGFSAALFMENVTLYNIAASGAILAMAFLRFRKVCAVHLAHFAGCIAGAAWMFSNSAYGAITQGDDAYRSTALNEGLINTISNNMKVIVDQFFLENILVWGMFTLLCVTCYGLYVRGAAKGKKYPCFVFAHLIAGLLMSFKCTGMGQGIFEKLGLSLTIVVWLYALIVMIYCLSALAIAAISVKELGVKLRVLFLMLSIPVLLAPLVVVNPIGARCFFAPYWMLTAVCVLLVTYIMEWMPLSGALKKLALLGALAVSVAMVVHYTGVYASIHRVEQLRDTYVQKQAEAGCREIVVCTLSREAYVWCGDPVDPWDERYKRLYSIDQEVPFQFMDLNEFEVWAQDFDQRTG